MISPHTSAVGPNQIMWWTDRAMLMRDIGTAITTNAIIILIMNAPAPLRSIVVITTSDTPLLKIILQCRGNKMVGVRHPQFSSSQS